MGNRKLAFPLFFFSCLLLSATPSFSIRVSAPMHEVKEKSMKLSVGGGARGGSFGGGAHGGSVGGGARGGGGSSESGGGGGSGRSPTVIPIIAGAGAASAHNGHHHSAANCQTSVLFFVTLGAAIMASVSLSF